jgi:hypothetical protein
MKHAQVVQKLSRVQAPKMDHTANTMEQEKNRTNTTDEYYNMPPLNSNVLCLYHL